MVGIGNSATGNLATAVCADGNVASIVSIASATTGETEALVWTQAGGLQNLQNLQDLLVQNGAVLPADRRFRSDQARLVREEWRMR